MKQGCQQRGAGCGTDLVAHHKKSPFVLYFFITGCKTTFMGAGIEGKRSYAFIVKAAGSGFSHPDPSRRG